MPLKIVKPAEIARILAVTDALRIHREAVRVPLAPVAGGGVRIEKGMLVIEAPEEDLEAFLAALPATITSLPGAAVLKPA